MQSLPVFKALPDVDSVFLWSLQFRNIQLMNAPMAGGIFLSYPNGIQLPYEAIKQQYNITNILESFVYYYINFCLYQQHTIDSQCICNFCSAFVQQSSETAIQAYSSAEVLAAQMQGLCNVFQQPFFVTYDMLADCNNTPRFPSQVQQVQYPSPILNIYPPTYDTSTNISTDITKENFQGAATQYTPITSIEQLRAISQQHLNHDTKIQQYEEQIQEMKQQIQEMQQQFREQAYKQEQKQLQEQYQAQQLQAQQQQPQLIYYQYPQQYIQPPLLQPIPIIQQNEKKLYSKSAHYSRIYSYRIPIKYNELIYRTDIVSITQYIRESLPIDEISRRTGIKMMDIHIIIMHIIFDLYNKGYNHDNVAKIYNLDRHDVAKYIELYRYLSYNKMLQ
jgi:hypothetical protein